MSKKTESKTENKPPAWAQPLFEQSASEASRLYNSGSGGNTYLGDTVAPLGGTTMSGVNQLAQAGQNWDTSGTRSLYGATGAASVSDPFVNRLSGVADGVQARDVDTSGIVSRDVNTSGIQGGRTNTAGIQGGQTNVSGVQGGNTNVSGIVSRDVGTGHYGGAQTAVRGIGSLSDQLLGGISSGRDGINTEGDFRDIYNRAQQPTSAAQNLQRYASGANLTGEGNPFYRQRLERDLADTAAQTQSLFSGAGRYGSGANTSVLTDRLAGQRIAALENDWNREQQNQFAATGMIDAANQNALGAQMGAVTGISGVQGQNIGNRLAASGQRIGAQSDMAGQLRGIADSQSGIMTGNADRALQSGIARAGFSAGDLDRGLHAGIARAGFSAGDLDRNLDAATTRAGFGAADLDRGLQAALGRAGFEAGNADRSLTAASTRAGFDAGNADRSLAASGLQGNLLAQAGNLRGQGLDRALSSTNAMAGLDQRNFENRLAGAGATLQAGGIMDRQAQAQLSDEIARFYALDNQDWSRLGMLQGAAAGAAGNYGIQNQTTRQPINPWGAIGGLFSGKSDVRLKEDIIRIGEANGIGIYRFRYKGQPEKWVGVMAQELPLGSEAVVLEDDGYLAVDYAKLGFPFMRAA